MYIRGFFAIHCPLAMELLDKITSKSARVGVIGLGYVGLPLLAAFHRAGFHVIGFDVDPAKIEALQRGENYLKHLGETLVRDMKLAGRFDATADFSRLPEADAVIICVPTPLGSHREPDLSYVRRTADEIARQASAGAACRARINHLSGHNPADRFAGAGIARTPMRKGFLPRILARNAKTPAEKTPIPKPSQN